MIETFSRVGITFPPVPQQQSGHSSCSHDCADLLFLKTFAHKVNGQDRHDLIHVECCVEMADGNALKLPVLEDTEYTRQALPFLFHCRTWEAFMFITPPCRLNWNQSQT
jgi:hypothetical protein